MGQKVGSPFVFIQDGAASRRGLIQALGCKIDMKGRIALPIGAAIGTVVAISVLRLTDHHVEITTNVADPETVFQALAAVSTAPIDRAGCKTNAPPTVGAFVTQYAASSFRPAYAAFQALHCDANKCYLSHGLAKQVEGGARVLEFEYDAQNKSVNSQNLRCLDVP